MATIRPERLRIDVECSPLDLLRACRGRDGLVALIGDWHHGEALIAFEPSRRATDPLAVDLPRIAGADDIVGGGWIGLWGYGEYAIGYYDHVVRLCDGQWWAEGLRGADELAAFAAVVEGLPTEPAQPEPYRLGTFEMTPSPAEHQGAVTRVVEHIAAGDIFQANLCARLTAEFDGDPLDVFCAGVAALAPAYAAFVTTPWGEVASFSPELFLRRTGDEVLTSPIKGTAPLDTDPAVLVASAKDRAENVMIVDLMRNDLGRVAVPGSVQVPAIARAEQHAVWHLVSDVVAHVAPGVTDSDLLRATFPPGSVTGAPKVRAMQIIAEQEVAPRRAYTGAIGHISPCSGLELNVVIRTFEFAGDRVWLGVGGGIVADSLPEAEYAECLVKARPLIHAIGGAIGGHLDSVATAPGPVAGAAPTPVLTIRDPSQGIFTTLLVLDGEPVDVEAHLARLDASVRAVYGQTIRAGLERAVLNKAARLSGHQRLRIDAVPKAGAVSINLSTSRLEHASGSWRLTPRVLAGGIGAHKWADRAGFAADDLILDVDGSVLETGRANLFLVLDDGVHTPPLDGRILAGTARARVVEQLRAAAIPVVQRRLTTRDLVRGSEVFASNTLRGVVPVVEVEGVGAWAAGPVAAALIEGRLSAPPRSPRRWAEQPRVLVVDNYDSFVYNLVQYAGELGALTTVVRNDHADLDELVAGSFSHLLISPGPGSPAEAGISADLVRRLGPTTPTLGVCLGHQVIGEVYGGTVVRAPEIVHGKPSLVHHDGLGVYAGLPTPVTCARYHSLVIDPATVPPELEVTARTASGIVMGVRHREYPVEGVQMHPESILTAHGHDMIANWLARVP